MLGVIGLILTAVLVVGVFITISALGTLKVANRQLAKESTDAWRAAGIAEQALASTIHNPLVDSGSVNTLSLALDEVRKAIDRKE